MQNVVLAQKIKSLCKIQGVSVASVLEKCNLTKGLIYDLEKRDKTPSIEKIWLLADYFGCSIDYLVGRSDEP